MQRDKDVTSPMCMAWELHRTFKYVFRSLARHRDAKKAQKQKLEEEEAKAKAARSFKARDIGSGLPRERQVHIETKQLTEFVPFRLSEDPTGRKARFEERKLREEEEARIASTFKASGIPISHDRPHVPTCKSTKPLCEVKNFVFSSDARAKKRAQFEKQSAARRFQRELEEKRMRERAEAARNAEIDAQLEAVQFHSKKSVKEVRSFLKQAPRRVQRSEVDLVVPCSPKLATSSRARAQEKLTSNQ